MAESSVKQQIVDKLKDSTNVLVTVNSNPSVDELSAALGITLLVNKLDKHGTAIFSGDVPPAIDFLKPEKTFESTVDSLRDFIIALDKEKADHLRYKVEGDMVKIFITPYRTVIDHNDLDFSQGDYNVDMVLAIGVKTEDDLDRALQSHGRILHDATVASISLDNETSFDGLQWVDSNASSYSEMLFGIAEAAKGSKNLIDEQIANAFLTGIVAATDRFSNNNTNSRVMTVAAQLMSAGANQQLIAAQLQENDQISAQEEPEEGPEKDSKDNGDMVEGERAKINRDETPPEEEPKEDDTAGALTISHMPEGTLDEVTEKIQKDESEAAAERAQEQLERQTNEVAEAKQQAAAEAAEARLAEQVAREPDMPTFEETPLRGAAPEPEPEEAPEQPVVEPVEPLKPEEAAEPMLGGTLNATTEQAAEDKRRQIADDRNRTILTHDAGNLISDRPTYHSPLNATMPNGNPEPEPVVRDIFAESSNPTAPIEAIQPPAPQDEPTLEEIDRQNRKSPDEALGDVHAAIAGGGDQPPLDAGLPPLPPMPDFSTLPPLPGEAPVGPVAMPPLPSSMPGFEPTPQPVDNTPATLGEILPPAPQEAVVAGAQPSDPGQFRIPGQ